MACLFSLEILRSPLAFSFSAGRRAWSPLREFSTCQTTLFDMDLMGPFNCRSKRALGAHWDSTHNAWRANLTVVLPNRGTTNMFLGHFVKLTEAARTYEECLVAYREVREQPNLTFEHLAVMLRAIAAAHGARPKRTKSSGYTGVSWNRNGKYWKTQLYIKDEGKGKIIHGGNFNDELAAAQAYQRAKLLWEQVRGIDERSEPALNHRVN
jgi:hypothetical protein